MFSEILYPRDEYVADKRMLRKELALDVRYANDVDAMAAEDFTDDD